MIVNFSIQNYRSIKDEVTLSFEAENLKDLDKYYLIQATPKLKLLKLGLIFGHNATGKTTILKALDFLRKLVLEPAEKKTLSLKYKPFLFDEKTVNQNTNLSLEFIQNKTKYLYEVEFNRDAIVKEKLYFFKPNKALVFSRQTNLEKQLSSIKFGSKISINKEHKSTLEANTLWNNTVLGGYLKTNFESNELQEAINWFEHTLKPLITPKTDLLAYISNKIEKEEINKANIVEFLTKADFKITDILIKKDEQETSEELIEFFQKYSKMSDQKINEDNKEVSYTLSYSDESQGTQRYYQFSGLLDFMIRNQVVFSIDELESSLHPDLLEHFILSFLVNTQKSQIIATTHYREFLMKKDIFRNDVIWFADKKTDGSTDLFSLTDFDSSIIRNTSSIYNAYKTGKLGAVPNLGDTYIDTTDEEG